MEDPNEIINYPVIKEEPAHEHTVLKILATSLPIIEEPKTKKNINIAESNPERDTVLIQDLNESCNRALEGWNNYITQTKSGRAKIDQISKINVDNFHSNSVPLFAFEIKEIVEGLIRIDDYDPDILCGYEEIFNSMAKADNKEKRAMLLRKLIICCKAVIPQSVQYVRPRTIIPKIGKAFTSKGD